MVKSTKKQPPSGAKRHRKITRPNIETGVTNPGVKRLTRQAGVKRTGANVIPRTRRLISDFLDDVLEVADAYRYADGDKPTLKVSHCNRALKHLGYPIYGYDDE